MRVIQQVERVARKTGKSASTIWRWVKAGCDLINPASIKQFLQGNKPRQHPNTVRKPKKETSPSAAEPDLDETELGPVGKRGAVAALARLEEIEERPYARLERAIEIGNPFQIKAAQKFCLRASETLRRLDLAVEIERRNAVELIPQKQAEAVSLYVAEWLRIAFAQFLSSEKPQPDGHHGSRGIRTLRDRPSPRNRICGCQNQSKN